MPKYSPGQIPTEVEGLVKAAREGSIGAKEFCRELQQRDIGGTRAMMYVRDAFGLSLEAAKAVVIENEYGSIETWEGLVEEALEEP